MFTKLFHRTALGLLLCGGLMLTATQAAILPVTGGLVLRLDASEINPFDTNQVTAGTVQQWNDLSPNANNVSETVAARRPLYVANGGAAFNGQSVVRFDGVDDFLEAGSSAFSNLGGDFVGLINQSQSTVFAVLRTNSTTDNQLAIDGVPSLGSTVHFPRVQVSGGSWFVGGNDNSFYAGDTSPTMNPTIYAQAFDGTAPATDRIALAIDGVDQTLTQVGGLPQANTGSVQRMLIGVWATGDFYWNGDIAEILIYDRLLTPIEQQEVGVYLENKYGLETAYVPEPSSFVFAGFSLLGLVCVIRRRVRR